MFHPGSVSNIKSAIPDPLLEEHRQILRSPLRYPGSKRRLCEYIAEILKFNEMKPSLFVEPFAGGASVSLYLMSMGLVDKIGLGEKDPLIAYFWKTVFHDTDWLIEQLDSIDISLKTWNKLKRKKHKNQRDYAIACIFLNRTSFSGILHSGAGPIGGQAQRSDYKIDCRFRLKEIKRRIKTAGEYADNVEFIWKRDWKQTINTVEKKRKGKKGSVFYYLDPPFYNKGKHLYNYYFTNRQHKAMCEFVGSLKTPWLISYDHADAIIEMYSANGFPHKPIEVIYSAATATGSHSASEVILTNRKAPPDLLDTLLPKLQDKRL